jgi:spermidine export protein MdtI
MPAKFTRKRKWKWPVTASNIYFLFAVLAGVLDVAANLASTKSNGFARRGWGALSILLVLAAFALLVEAIKGMELAIAYAILGATGIFGTAISARILFGQKLKPIGWVGLVLVFAAVVVLHTA